MPFSIICDRSIFSPIYNPEPSKAELESIYKCWDFFRDICSRGTIGLYTSGEVWEKVFPQLGDATPWVAGLFAIETTTYSSPSKFSEEDAIIESAKTLMGIPQNHGVLILSNTDKIKSQDRNIVVMPSQEFISRVEWVENLPVKWHEQGKILLYEIIIFQPEQIEKLETMLKELAK